MKQHNIIIFVRTHDGDKALYLMSLSFPPDGKNVSDLFEHNQLLVWQPYYYFQRSCLLPQGGMIGMMASIKSPVIESVRMKSEVEEKSEISEADFFMS